MKERGERERKKEKGTRPLWCEKKHVSRNRDAILGAKRVFSLTGVQGGSEKRD